MKVLIDDGMQVRVGTGIGKYSGYLFRSLKNRGLCEKVDLSSFTPEHETKKAARFAYMKYINSKAYGKLCGEYDVVHYTNYLMPFRKHKGTKYVVTIHDLASFLHPESLPAMYRGYSRFAIKHAMRNADTILTVSYAAKAEIDGMWPQYASKVKVAYPGLYSEYEAEDATAPYQLEVLNDLEDKKFFLFVGTVETRKNLGIVIDAFFQLKESMPNDYKLVLAGRPGYGFDAYQEKIEASAYQSDIICTGYISSEDVRKLYRQAAAYVFPTIYEGFGSTQLECMVNHLPLILSDIPTNREVSEGYGLFFQLDSVDSLLENMRVIISGEIDTDELNRIADSICAKFSWQNLIFDYVEAYRDCIKQ